MLNRSLNEITKNDLLELVTQGILEHKTLEYKQSLPGPLDTDREKFLAEISSMANASGGDIIYGMAEDRETGKPKSLEGLDITNYDKEKLRLENMMRMGIQPRIPSINISPPISLDNSKVALVIRVSKSWISPHRVLSNDKFYSRNSSGKYPLDVSELRIAFNLSELVSEKIRNFRSQRIANIVANETTVELQQNPKIILHLIPMSSFSDVRIYNTKIIIENNVHMFPLGNSGYNLKYNLDGIVAYSNTTNRKSRAYVQFFKNGVIEAVNASMISGGSQRPVIPGNYEVKIVESTKEYLSVCKSLDVEFPLIVFLSIVGVKGYYMGVSRVDFDIEEDICIDRDALLLPEVIVEKYSDDPTKFFKSTFDSIWNACGFKRSLNYNDTEDWAPR